MALEGGEAYSHVLAFASKCLGRGYKPRIAYAQH